MTKIREEVLAEIRDEAFRFLGCLRESGICNMFGAAPYLEDEFKLTRYEARQLLMEWMKSFKV
jgi:hypothetical protein